MTASAMTTGVAHLAASGNSWQAEPDHPEGADLVEHADEQHRGGRAGLGRGVGQPGVHRPHRRLDGEREEEAEEQQPLGGRVEAEPGEVGEQEAVGPPGPCE